jgi:hypothetical protein
MVSPRRHHRVPANPVTATATDAANTAVHAHSLAGAGSEASPSEFMYARAANATMTPVPAETGSHIRRQRRLRQPIATTSSTTVTT